MLGSATPSLESYQNAAAGRYELRRRSSGGSSTGRWPHVHGGQHARGVRRPRPDVVLSQALAEAIGARLARREQVLVLLNRRGYATAVFCRQCAGTVDCPNCSVSLTVHTRAAT